eukprot:m.888598 g.888598  ORF g.888598 m.888598 type:complete len:284 (+) comp23639_c0_seq3:905-1756(+)
MPTPPRGEQPVLHAQSMHKRSLLRGHKQCVHDRCHVGRGGSRWHTVTTTGTAGTARFTNDNSAAYRGFRTVASWKAVLPLLLAVDAEGDAECVGARLLSSCVGWVGERGLAKADSIEWLGSEPGTGEVDDTSMSCRATSPPSPPFPAGLGDERSFRRQNHDEPLLLGGLVFRVRAPDGDSDGVSAPGGMPPLFVGCGWECSWRLFPVSFGGSVGSACSGMNRPLGSVCRGGTADAGDERGASALWGMEARPTLPLTLILEPKRRQPLPVLLLLLTVAVVRSEF